MTEKYNVLIVDDHPLIIDSLVRMFDNEEDLGSLELLNHHEMD